MKTGYEKLRAISLQTRTKRHLEQPLYYNAKWWARRLAVVTNWMIKQAMNVQSGLVLDPFTGSGTTLGEALRLGHRVIGVEINPFAANLASSSFEHRHPDLETKYRNIISDTLKSIEPLYGGTNSPTGYFWAYEVDCPTCGYPSLLLKRTLIVKHAYSKRYPRGWALCPRDRNVVEVKDVNAANAKCSCGCRFSLHPPVSGRFKCQKCHNPLHPSIPGNEEKSIPRTVLVAVELNTKGKRLFIKPSSENLKLAHSADNLKVSLTPSPIDSGQSTAQVLAWGFRDWAQLFHPRQLVFASSLADRVHSVEDISLRRQLALAFSPIFEYHCRLSSFKGLGTGSIRQAFSRPILHPVSISYESNPVIREKGRSRSGNPRSWYKLRTKPSEQAFQTLIEDRGNRLKVGSVSQVLSNTADVAVLCMDSGKLSLPPESVDAVITDPPYFNRLFYDDVAGALNAWMVWCGLENPTSSKGVQSDDRKAFTKGLNNVFRASTAALKPGSPLVFTYHHTLLDAWAGLAEALENLGVSGKSVVLVPSEMPNTLIKSRSHQPIQCDAVLSFVKKKRSPFKDIVNRAAKLAIQVLDSSDSYLDGDVMSASYAAALIIGMDGTDSLGNWDTYMRDVRERVDRIYQREVF
ncbi:MAG: hypothetical protein KAR40_00140 [Candidatus Sabulitectum sp.]|nr:hypothetical protein [Candidatus Sabulitectum sp.]